VSILCTVTSASSDQLAQLLTSPAYIAPFLFGPPPLSRLDRLWALVGRGVSPPPPWLTAPPPEHLALGKAWDGIRFLLTGTTDPDDGPLPEAFLGHGGDAVGTEDLGYGPARAFSPAATGAIATCLASYTPDALEARFDPVRFSSQHIYPGTIWHRERSQSIGWLLDEFVCLQGFTRAVAERNHGIIIALV
jgi:hypothetical protein